MECVKGESREAGALGSPRLRIQAKGHSWDAKFATGTSAREARGEDVGGGGCKGRVADKVAGDRLPEVQLRTSHGKFAG